jgi:hypothetical protein
MAIAAESMQNSFIMVAAAGTLVASVGFGTSGHNDKTPGDVIGDGFQNGAWHSEASAPSRSRLKRSLSSAQTTIKTHIRISDDARHLITVHT